VLCPGGAGSISRAGTPGFYNRSNHGLPAGAQGGSAPGEENQQCEYLEAEISRQEAQRRLIDELLGNVRRRGKPVMSHLVESGSLSLEDLKEAERELRQMAGKDKPK